MLHPMCMKCCEMKTILLCKRKTSRDSMCSQAGIRTPPSSSRASTALRPRRGTVPEQHMEIESEMRGQTSWKRIMVQACT